MTAERTRKPINPLQAHIELYKVKHGKQNLSDVFDVEEEPLTASQPDGAEKSRKSVNSEKLNSQFSSDELCTFGILMRVINQSAPVSHVRTSSEVNIRNGLNITPWPMRWL